MASTLVSPGVQVTVVDESQYLPAATNSVPFVVIATASNKLSADGTGIAPGTLAVNAGKLFLATSQRALSANYGVPFFYQTTNGTPINGYELNEYGLLAAYSALGVTNQCYVLRADIDLAALTASLTRPTGSPNNGTYWLDTVNTQWGLFTWNQVSGTFTNLIPSVITNQDYLTPSSTVPLQSYGSIGQYAVVATNTSNPIYFKRGGPTPSQSNATAITSLYNTWVQLGSAPWQTSWPTIQGTNTPSGSSLTAGDTFKINNTLITVPSSPTVSLISNAINAAGITGVYAANIGGSLNLYADTTAGIVSTVTGLTSNGSTATVTFSTAVPTTYVVGSTIYLSGIVNAGINASLYNGYFTVTASTTTSVSFATTTTSAYVSGGTAINEGTVVLANNAGTSFAALGLTAGTYNAPTYQVSPSYTVPQWNTFSAMPEPTGSVWQKSNSVNQGTSIVMKQYNSTLGLYVIQSVTVYPSDNAALYGLDPSGGGQGIPTGTLYARSNPVSDGTSGYQILERYTTGPTIVTGSNTTQTFSSGQSFSLGASQPGTAVNQWRTVSLVSIGHSGNPTASDFVAAISAAGIPYVSATINSAALT